MLMDPIERLKDSMDEFRQSVDHVMKELEHHYDEGDYHCMNYLIDKKLRSCITGLLSDLNCARSFELQMENLKRDRKNWADKF